MIFLRARSVVWLLAIVACLVSTSAFAANPKPEQVAKEALMKGAADYTAGQFERALGRLDKALTGCGKCSDDTRASLLRDKAVMQARMGKASDAIDTFTEALVLSPSMQLPKAYDVPAVRAAYIKGKATAAKAQPAEGDFSHKPWVEQRTGTPLPIYAEYDGKVSRVVVRYLAPGDDEWKRLNLRRMGNGWAGVIPCVAMDEGLLRYYLQGLDEDEMPVASSGDKNHPYKVTVQSEIDGVAPHLPGRHAPKPCAENGCEKDPAACGAEPTAPPVTNGTEESGLTGEFARVWFGFAGSAGFALRGSATDTCLLVGGAPANSAYYCTAPDGSTDFPSRGSGDENASLSHGTAGNASAGVSPSAIRVMFSFDFAATKNLLVGARLGYVFGTYAGQAAKTDGKILPIPLHAELRGSWVFGESPLAREGFAPLLMLAAGTTRIDADTTVLVNRKGIAGQRPEVAWTMGGPFFAGVGGGFRYAFSSRVGFTTVLRVDVPFGGGGIVPAANLESGLQYGF